MNRRHVYTGPGKGKTTAALGLALRSLGHGNRVVIAAFMKNADAGEWAALKAFPEARLFFPPPMQKFTFQMTPEELAFTSREQTAFARSLTDLISRERPQTVILDELCPALSLGLIDEDTARALVDAALTQGETAATGRDAPAWLRERADYVSVIQCEKHPYDTESLPARAGVEL